MQAGFRPVKRLIRLAPRSIKDDTIPWHPAFAGIAPSTHQRPTLDQFLSEVLRQALHFTSRVIPSDPHDAPPQNPTSKRPTRSSSSWRPKSVKKVDGIDVRIYARKLRPDEFHVPVTGTNSSASDAHSPPIDPKEETEYWFARRSVHENLKGEGTASFGEFEEGLKENHAENEAEYTPGIKWVRKLVAWEGAGDRWADVSMSIYEICHGLPPGLSSRIFPILLIAAKTSPSEFLVISLPLKDTHLLPESAIPSYSASAVVAKYVAVERVRVLGGVEGGSGQEADGGVVEWLMCTASNACGWLPMVVQKGKIPGVIAKDVGLFLGWVGGRRRMGKGEEELEESEERTGGGGE
ncbi:hypothetical protein FGG08_002156 [Glutinoglossum americanum]|uniref:DUF3074 domain-containing protein n=1 Tax=Glutinoglossum americanum TaxID=1670608 RepID=A0A9P8I9P7_9PEZI|nr:hypothetical protein FGG08_002156 [Glutinoglossum americanum]